MNHSLRAFASLYIDKIKHFLSLSKMSILTFILFLIGFIVTFIILNVPNVSPYWGLLYFCFISLVIGIQLAFRLLCICRLYLFMPPDRRATLSSVNSAVSRLYGAFFFILIKILLDGVSLRNSFAICFIVFIVLSIPLKAVYSIQSKEDGYVKK